MKRGPWVIAAWWAIFSLWWGEARRDGRRLSVTSQPKCGSGGCGKRPVFGDPLVKIACRCAQHKLPGYENLFGFQCEGEGCNKSAYFGSLEDGVRRFCGQHRGFGQSNLMSRSCLDPTGCVKRACYGNGEREFALFRHLPTLPSGIHTQLLLCCLRRRPHTPLLRKAQACIPRGRCQQKMFLHWLQSVRI